MAGPYPAILKALTTEAIQSERWARLRPSGGPRKEYMAEVHEVSVTIGGAEITFETGRLAKQASGAVLVASGDTRVLGTATAGNLRDIDFMPLTVDIEERMYAAGKIPGSFFKREGRAGEKATLIARMIDRPLRPLFPKGWRYETQLVSIPLSIDHEHPYDILAMNGASAALMISNIPFPTPVGAVRIGKVEGNFVVNPTEEQQLTADLDLVVAGTDEAILMVEAGANEITETEMLDALDIAHGEIKKLCAVQLELASQGLEGEARGHGPGGRRGASSPRSARRTAPRRRGDQRPGQARAPGRHQGGRGAGARAVLGRPRRRDVRGLPLQGAGRVRQAREGRRSASGSPSTRSARTAARRRRSATITIEAGLLPRTHGSALFTRGQTQALSVVALGTTREEMRLDNLGLETSKRYFHHYNFPPFSVGEAGFMRGPKRRDIGHGALAERALVPMIPGQDEFPYTIRVVSDILESNGSSSMASVCGSSLSLMDAGVPLKAPVAGVAMGLIKEGDDYTVLTDIAGVEDHLGDMDFKVAGTENGITALQMDIKITGVTFDILRDALAQAKEGRTFILGKMHEVISTPRTELSEFAPRISSISIDPDKIGLLIGKGGETIRGLSEEFEAQIDVEDDGTVRVYAQTGQQGDALVDRIRSMTKEVEVGDEFPTAKVVKTTTFGAFVELAKGTDGLLHISNVSPGQRVATVEEVLNKGDDIAVRVVEVDKERGRIGLRLAEDPDIAGKTKEELTSVGTGDPSMGNGGGRDRGRRGPRRDGGGGRRPGPRPAPARRPRPRARLSALPEHRLTTLDSGLRVVTEAMPSVRSAALGFFVGAGSRGERTEEAGLSHFLEHMLFRGTERYGSAEIDQLFDGMGAELNAGTDKEGTTVYARMLDQHLPRAFDVIADMVWRPAFNDVDPEREVVLEEIAMYEDDPQDTVFDVLGDAVFGDHPLGRPIIGRAPVIRDTPVADIAAFHARRYVPSSVVIAAAGSVDHDVVVELAERTLAGLRAGAQAPVPDAAPARPPARVRFQAKETEQVHVCLGATGLPRHDDRRHALRVLDAIFGGLSSSRLFQSVREERGLAYAVYSFSGQFTDSGQIGLYVGTRPDKVAEAMDVVRAELERMREQPATEDELARARENVKARIVLALESSAARMNRLGGATLYDLPLLDTDAVMAKIDAVTLDDLRGLVDELWAPERLSAAGIGPSREAFSEAVAPVCPAAEPVAA